MRELVRRFFDALMPGAARCAGRKAPWLALPLLTLLPGAALLAGAALNAQVPNRITHEVDPARLQVLTNHHPLWANPANDAGVLPANQVMGSLTLVLARSPEQEQALEQLIADQQNPASSAFHQWLTPAEVGARFGLSDQDLATLTGWLEAQGLHVDWVSPSRAFIGFSGTAADLGQAFGTEIHSYNVRGAKRISVASDPVIPQSLAPAIRAIRGLYTIEDRPLHRMTAPQSSDPEMTVANGGNSSYFIAPADFDTIYDVPPSLTGAGQTIGIVAQSRTDFADFSNFKALTGATFANPTEVVPPGGVDPGPAYTAPPRSGGSVADQSEATLDVFRAGSVAPGANLLLVVATEASGGIATDAQYLVNTTPVPANIMTISFGECESEAGRAGVQFWDQLFQQAAAEGISVFVSSGDSGASGCDSAFTAPPASPAANSPNSICSSSYATCVGGTEFNDASHPSTYWNSTSGADLLSALGYIPEGGWNEPGSSGTTKVASSGGGVSLYIPTPSWQTGIGVPSARTGRYTPDISFSSSCHDGYFGCLAADGATCASGSSGSYTFVGYCGTSAAAPGMAGVAALLNQKRGGAQGNLNPAIYQESAAVPAAFHDVTVSTSGVASCSVGTPSMCNNSAPGPTSLTGGQQGFLLTAGYDEVTGLGSLDVQQFLNNYGGIIIPTITVSLSGSSVTTAQSLAVTITVSGGSGNATPTGSVTLTSGGYTSAPTALAGGSASISIPAGSLTVGTDTLTANYTPDSNSASTYGDATGSQSVTVTSTSNATPTVTTNPSAAQISAGQALTMAVTVAGTSGNPTPTGSVKLTSGSYTSGAATLASGSATMFIPAGALALGTNTLTATYNPDSASSSIYNPANGTATVTVTAKVSPMVTVAPSPSSITTAQGTTVAVTVTSGGGYPAATGSITLTSGSYASVATTVASGGASITIPAGALAAGTDILTASYTPDSNSSQYYNPSSGTATILVTSATAPGLTMSGTGVSINPGATSGNASTIMVTPTGGFTGSVTLTATVTASPAGAQDLPTLSFGSTSPVNLTGTNAGTATLTISTTAATTGMLERRVPPAVRGYRGGGAALACVFLLCLPARRRSWRRLLGLAMLAVVMAGVQSCGGGSGTTVTTPPSKTTPTVTVTAAPTTVTSAQPFNVTTSVNGGSGNAIPTGNVMFVSGSYSSTAMTLSSGSATFNVPAGSLPVGTDPLNATYTPDASSSATYNSASGTNTIAVTTGSTPGTTAGNYTITITGTSGSVTGTTTITLVVQ